MKREVSDLFLTVAAMEEKWRGDREKLEQLLDLRRRLVEEIQETGFPPPDEIVDSLLRLIEEGKLNEAVDSLATIVPKLIADLRLRASGAAKHEASTTCDLSYRPASYWLDDNTGRPYRGTLRHDIPYPLNDEFLPEYKDGEVEIARVSLCSSTGDVISVRARRQSDFIAYRVVDEYETDYKCSPKQCRGPLTMSELIELIDTASQGEDNEYVGLVISSIEANMDASKPSELIDFVIVSSQYYPDLQPYYEQRVMEFLRERQSEVEQL